MGDIAQVAEHFSTSEEVVEEMLQEIQELDPAGVGARNLQECLLLQVERIKDYSDVTVEIIKNYMEEVAKKSSAKHCEKASGFSGGSAGCL